MKNKKIIILAFVLLLVIMFGVVLSIKSCRGKEEQNKNPDKQQTMEEVEENAEENAEEETADYENDIANWDTAIDNNDAQNIVSKKEDKADTSAQNKEDSNTDSSAENESESKPESDAESGAESSTNTSETESTYTITYVLDYDVASISADTQKVVYGEEVTLLKPIVPENEDYVFVKWVITGTDKEFKNGIYDVKGDLSLTAVWERVYTKNY